GMAALASARRRHHAERAVLLAPFHHGDECLEPCRAVRPRGDLDERTFAGLEDRPAAFLDARQQVTDSCNGGRSEHEIDVGCALSDLALLELGHAAHDADDQIWTRAF